MGLDITSYMNLKKIDATVDEFNENVAYDANGMQLLRDEWVNLWVDKDFIRHADGIEDGIYTFDDCGGDTISSHSYYNTWRDELETMVATDGRKPFGELINFSDCEGVIGTLTSAKLLADFLEWDDIAEQFGREVANFSDPTSFYRIYSKFREAFKMAAENGAVIFH